MNIKQQINNFKEMAGAPANILKTYLNLISQGFCTDTISFQQERVSNLMTEIPYPQRSDIILKMREGSLENLFPCADFADRHFSTVRFDEGIIITTNSGPFSDENYARSDDNTERLLEMCASEQGIMWRFNYQTVFDCINSAKMQDDMSNKIRSLMSSPAATSNGMAVGQSLEQAEKDEFIQELNQDLVIADFGFGSGVYTVILLKKLFEYTRKNKLKVDLDKIIIDAIDINPTTLQALETNLTINGLSIEKRSGFWYISDKDYPESKAIRIRIVNCNFSEYKPLEKASLRSGFIQDGYHPDSECLGGDNNPSNTSYHAWGSGKDLLKNEPHIDIGKVNNIQAALGSNTFAKEFARRLDKLHRNGIYTINQGMFLDKHFVPEWLHYLNTSEIPAFELVLRPMHGFYDSKEFLGEVWGSSKSAEVNLVAESYPYYTVDYGILKRAISGHQVFIQGDIESKVVLENGIKVIRGQCEIPRGGVLDLFGKGLDVGAKATKFWRLRMAWHRDIQGRMV